MTSNQNKPTPNEQQNFQNTLDFNLITYAKSLVSLLKQALCPSCNRFWDGSTTVKGGNGLYMQLQFICNSCCYHVPLYSSLSVKHSRRHEINVRLTVDGSLCGLSHGGLMKLLNGLNLPLTVQQHEYTET